MLPTELVEIVIYHCKEDKSALLTAALVSRTWADITRRVLFDPILSSHAHDICSITSKRAMSFALLYGHACSTIPRFLQHLSLRGPGNPEEWIVGFVDQLVSNPHYPGLLSFELCYVHISDDITAALHPILRDISTLRLKFVDFPDLDFEELPPYDTLLASCTSLEELIIEDDYNEHRSGILSPSPLLHNIRLQGLLVDFVDSDCLDYLLQGLRPCVGELKRFVAEEVDVSSLAVYLRFMDIISSTLEELTISFWAQTLVGHDPSPDLIQFLEMARFPRLRKLTLKDSAESRAGLNASFHSTRLFHDSVRSTSSLESLTIQFAAPWRNIGFEMETWIDLLRLPQLSGVRHVLFLYNRWPLEQVYGLVRRVQEANLVQNIEFQAAVPLYQPS